MWLKKIHVCTLTAVLLVNFARFDICSVVVPASSNSSTVSLSNFKCQNPLKRFITVSSQENTRYMKSSVVSQSIDDTKTSLFTRKNDNMYPWMRNVELFSNTDNIIFSLVFQHWLW